MTTAVAGTGPRLRFPRIKVKIHVSREGGGGGNDPNRRPGLIRRAMKALGLCRNR